MTAPRAVAVFDLDGTITLRDTSVAFIAFAIRPRPVLLSRLWAGACFIPDAIYTAGSEWLGAGERLGGFAGRLETRMHERMVAAGLRGMTRARLLETAEGFAAEVIAGNLRPGAREWIAAHRDRGETLLLASASLDVYVESLRALLGFDAAVATRLEFRDDVATGRFAGLPCWGMEKLRRVREVAAGAEIGHAYGDSPGDRPLLAAARKAVWVGGPARSGEGFYRRAAEQTERPGNVRGRSAS